MKFTTAAVSAALAVIGASAFTQKPTTAFVQKSTASFTQTQITESKRHPAGCGCSSCTTISSFHPSGCGCIKCATSTVLFSTTTEEDTSLPAEVEALDGINDETEAHNAERPARKSLKKKGSKGKPLSEFEAGQTVTAKVKSIASYGAFMDFGGETDGLLHISNLAVGFVQNVGDILEEGNEYEVRILGIDEKKKQVSLSLLSPAEEEEARQPPPPKRERAPQQSQRSDDAAVLSSLKEKGWDPAQFVTGTVVNTVDFGAFVRIDCSQLNSEVEGEIDGLVHISALANQRVDSVSSIVNENDSVQVRVKSIDKNKVSLSMVSVEDEQAKAEARGVPQDDMGNKDWKEALEKLQTDMPKFENKPMVVDLRKKD